MNIVLLGYPGSGKGTQAELLAKKYGFMHISTGDLIRQEIAQGTALGVKIKDLISRGNLASDEDTVRLLINAINDRDDGIIFDGFPRTTAQAQTLDKYLARHGKKVDDIVLLSMREEVVLKRITSRRVCSVPSCGAVYNATSPDFKEICAKCGGTLVTRPDDSLESAKHRFEVFKKETQPLINYYQKSAGFKKVDGNGAPAEVFAGVARALGLKK
ncbi:MAG: adenylate kinase [Elusimicrobiota bacterium]|jgi:adenylate kinase|nr:adenylate kinase [Elusimicrobiota bacterium]